MDTEQIAQEIRELTDRLDRVETSTAETFQRMKSLERHSAAVSLIEANDRLAGHDKMLANYAAELGVLANIVERLARTLPVGLNDGG